MDCSTPGLPVHHQLPELTQTHVHWGSDVIQPSHPLSPPSPPAFNLSQHRGLFQWIVLHIRWPEYWGFSFNISPFNEYSGLISFMMDWLNLLAIQGTLRSLLQHQSSKASILRCTAYFNLNKIILNMTKINASVNWDMKQNYQLKEGKLWYKKTCSEYWNHKQGMKGKKAKIQLQDRKQTLLWSHRCRH